MAISWKTGAVATTLPIAIILAIVLNTTGMSYQTDGDKACTDCFSEITTNSTFWEYCVEHAGNKTAIFAKDTASRRRWINLDRINEIVATDPAIHVDLMVRTTKSASELDSDYGPLRKVKDGDCIIKRYSKANNPNPSRFYLHGQKGASQTIKWGFEAENALGEDISIDPKWLPVEGSWEYIQSCKDIIGDVPIRQNITKEKEVYGTCTETSYFLFYNNLTKPTTTENRTLQSGYECVVGAENYVFEEVIGAKKGIVGQDCINIGMVFNGKKVLYAANDYACCKEFKGDMACEKEHQSNKDCEIQSGEGWDFNVTGAIVSTVSKASFVKEVKVENA